MGFTIGFSGTALDTRAALIGGTGMTFGDFWGVDASSANGAQPVATFFDREGLAPLRIVRGTAGTTNLVVIDQSAASGFVQVQTATTLTSSATVVA